MWPDELHKPKKKKIDTRCLIVTPRLVRRLLLCYNIQTKLDAMLDAFGLRIRYTTLASFISKTEPPGKISEGRCNLNAWMVYPPQKSCTTKPNQTKLSILQRRACKISLVFNDPPIPDNSCILDYPLRREIPF
jgi:hypothetical protein